MANVVMEWVKVDVRFVNVGDVIRHPAVDDPEVNPRLGKVVVDVWTGDLYVVFRFGDEAPDLWVMLGEKVERWEPARVAS